MSPDEIRSASADIYDGSVQRRQVIARAWLEKARSDLIHLNELRDSIAAAYREHVEAWTGRVCAPGERPAELGEFQAQADRMKLCAVAATILEIMLAALVAAWSLNFTTHVSALAGGIIAVLLVLTVEGVHLSAYRPDHPAASRTAVHRWLRIAFAVFAVGIIPLLVSRTAPEAASLANVALPVVTVGLTLTSAFLFILSFMLSWSRRYTRRYAAVLHEIQETARFIHELESLLRQKDVRIATFAR